MSDSFTVYTFTVREALQRVCRAELRMECPIRDRHRLNKLTLSWRTNGVIYDPTVLKSPLLVTCLIIIFSR